ncbi:MAG: hypothetical protein B7X60_01480 [Polynucleobacter sp. 39-45-136]|jgi:hypothetical protein|nr:MAG: hypothetical protein B7X60_01480 [Polynucleobacter sp. 39-45-136]
MSSPLPPEPSQNDGEISLLGIISFLADSWKKLAIAGIAGAVLGLSGWLVLGKYEAKISLANANANAITLSSLKALQQTLPNLAAQMVEKNRVPQGQEAIYKAMSDVAWWPKHLTPVFSLSKADIKDLGPAYKSEANPILFLMVEVGASSRDLAIEQAKVASQFLRSGAMYLGAQTMLKAQEIGLLNARAEIDQKYNSTLIELEYQKERLRGLEDLAKRFPVENRVSSQVVDPKDSGAKYMPLSTQIIAINTEINANTELLKRLADKKQYLGSVEQWHSIAKTVAANSQNGIDLNAQLLKLEAAQRAQAGANNPRALFFFDEVRASLLANEATYALGLVESPVVSVTRRGMIKSTAGGLAATFFLMLLFLLGQRVWANIKGGDTK